VPAIDEGEGVRRDEYYREGEGYPRSFPKDAERQGEGHPEKQKDAR
jgi:hypothetical protein